MVATMLNGRVCMKARDLLSWNIHDLAHQTNLPPNIIADFEKGRHQLVRHQNFRIREIFEGQGVIFGEKMEVTMGKKKSNPAMERLRHMNKQQSTKTQSQLVLERLRQKTNNPPKL